MIKNGFSVSHVQKKEVLDAKTLKIRKDLFISPASHHQRKKNYLEKFSKSPAKRSKRISVK